MSFFSFFFCFGGVFLDEIILERDLPFLSSRLIVFFDTKREEGTLEPVVRERERGRASCALLQEEVVFCGGGGKQYYYYVRVINHRGGCDDPGGVRRESDRPNVEEAVLLRERRNVSRGAVRSKISKKEFDDDARKLWAVVVVKVCRRRESRGEGDDDRREHENSHAGGHEQRLQRVPVALAVGKSELVSSRVFQKCQVRPHDPVRFVQRALGIVSNKKWQNWMRERRVRAQSVPFIPRHAS